MKTLAVHFGNGKALWFALLAITMLFYVDSQSVMFLVVFGFAGMILLIQPHKAMMKISKIGRSRPIELARVFGVQAGSVFLAKRIRSAHSPERFDVMAFQPQSHENKQWSLGLVLATYRLDEEEWIRVLVDDALNLQIGTAAMPSGGRAGYVYKIGGPELFPQQNRLVGTVAERTTIERLRFEYLSVAPVQEGDLLSVRIGGCDVLYQVVEGITGFEILESHNKAGRMTGEAVQLGSWNQERRCFDRFGWIPPMNAGVFLAGDIDVPPAAPTEFQIGEIPGTNFPVFIDREDAVTHHLAVLGVTGSGKSVFSRNLIREIARDGTKVICVDFTNEYADRLSDLIGGALVSGDEAKGLFQAVDSLGEELEKFPNRRSKTTIKDAEDKLRSGFTNAFRAFMKGTDEAVLFELPDVTNSTGILEYTRWFFRVLFELAKEGKFGSQRVCVVLEEAHTVVPEWNFLGIEDKRSSSVVNSIAQIALQGRKYGVGFLVIAQRSANVSKTVLTQCNSVVAFQQFDRTSADFLGNYMGTNFVSALTKLKPRHAIAVGKAFSSGTPIIFKVPDIVEPHNTDG